MTDPTTSTVHREENMECEYNFTAPTNMFVYFQLPSCALRATFDCLLENVRIPMQFGDSVVHNVVCGPGQPVSNASTITGLTTVSVRFRSHLTAASPAPPCVGLFFACECRPTSLWKTKCMKKVSDKGRSSFPARVLDWWSWIHTKNHCFFSQLIKPVCPSLFAWWLRLHETLRCEKKNSGSLCEKKSQNSDCFDV